MKSRSIFCLYSIFFFSYRPLYTVVYVMAISCPKVISILYPWKNSVTSRFSFYSNSKRRQGHSFLTSSPKTNKTSIYFKNNIHVLISLWKVILPGLWVHFYGYITNLLHQELLLCYPRYGNSRLLFCSRSLIRIRSKSVHCVTFLESVTRDWVSGSRMYYKCFSWCQIFFYQTLNVEQFAMKICKNEVIFSTTSICMTKGFSWNLVL